MATSELHYVGDFEACNKCKPNTFIVVKLDGKGFEKFTKAHEFIKPHDVYGLYLMSKAAACVMEEFKDIVCAYGYSDEYNFIFRQDSNIYDRRVEKIISAVNGLFTSSYVYHWDSFFSKKLKYPPVFDAKIIIFPSLKNLQDYLSWRQAEAHTHNLYSTAFWGLVQTCGHSCKEAEEILDKTTSSEQVEILHQKCNFNYSDEWDHYKNGTLLVKVYVPIPKRSSSYHTVYVLVYYDISTCEFWNEHKDLFVSNKDRPILENISDRFEIVFVKLYSNFKPKEEQEYSCQIHDRNIQAKSIDI